MHLLATVQELDKRVQTLAKASMTLCKIIDEQDKRLKALEVRFPEPEQLTKAQDQGGVV